MHNEIDNEMYKMKDADEVYYRYIEELLKMNPPTKEVIYNFPVFVGQVNLARSLFFYEMYKKVIPLTGNIAEIGTYKGASFLLWAKLIKLFEPYNTTRVFGFDWFEGMDPGDNDDMDRKGDYKANYETLKKLITLQDLDSVSVLNKMDVTKELEAYLDERPYLRFKLVFVDCGIENVIDTSLRLLWPRLVQGGVLIMDHYGVSSSPTESALTEKYIGNNKVLQMPFNRHSTGYVIKNGKD